MPTDDSTRRGFLRSSSIASATLLIPSLALSQKQPTDKKKDNDNDNDPDADKISPAEDLMREHGVLNRILLIYDTISPC
jgi:hypothetical protein